MEELKEITETSNAAPEKKEKPEKKKSVRPIICLALVAVIVVSLAACFIVSKSAKPKVTSELIIAKLEKASELTTAKMIYADLISYSDHKIPYLNEEAFSMTYKATVRAGFSMDQLKVEVMNNKVIITVPEITILGIEIDESNIKFYDKKFALFKDDSKEDVIEAMKQAKAEIEEKPEMDELIEMARTQTDSLLRNLLQDSIGNKELEIQFA